MAEVCIQFTTVVCRTTVSNDLERWRGANGGSTGWSAPAIWRMSLFLPMGLHFSSGETVSGVPAIQRELVPYSPHAQTSIPVIRSKHSFAQEKGHSGTYHVPFCGFTYMTMERIWWSKMENSLKLQAQVWKLQGKTITRGFFQENGRSTFQWAVLQTEQMAWPLFWVW